MKNVIMILMIISASPLSKRNKQTSVCLKCSSKLLRRIMENQEISRARTRVEGQENFNAKTTKLLATHNFCTVLYIVVVRMKSNIEDV